MSEKGQEERADRKAVLGRGLHDSAEEVEVEGRKGPRRAEQTEMPGSASKLEKDGKREREDPNVSGQPRRDERENGEDSRRTGERHNVRRQNESLPPQKRGAEEESREEVKKRKYSPIVWDKSQGGKDPSLGSGARSVDERPAVKSRLGAPPPAPARPPVAMLDDRRKAGDRRVAEGIVGSERPDSLKDRSESRERRRASPGRDRVTEDRSKVDLKDSRNSRDRPRDGERREEGHRQHRHREDDSRGRSKHRAHEPRARSEGQRDTQRGDRDASREKERQSLKEEKPQAKTDDQKPLEQSAIGAVAPVGNEQVDLRHETRSPSVSSSSSSALSDGSPPKADVRGETPEPGQLPDSPQVQEDKSQGLLKSRWLEPEELSPEEEGRVKELLGSAKKRRLDSEEREDSGFKRRPASVAGSRNNLRIGEEGEIEAEPSPAIKVGSVERGEKSGSRGDSYERELNRRELEEIDNESEGEEELGRPGSVSSDDEDPGNPVLQEQPKVNMLEGCRSVDEFERLNKIDEGEVNSVLWVTYLGLGKLSVVSLECVLADFLKANISFSQGVLLRGMKQTPSP